MTYDVDAGEPELVAYQRRLEDVVAQVREVLTNDRLTKLGILALIVYGAMNADFSSASSSSSSFLEGLTLAVVVDGAIWYVGFLVAMLVVIALHEACHAFAFDHYGVTPEWTITWAEVRGKPLVVLPPFGGVCWPKHDVQWFRLTYLEDAVVSLAPLALAAVGLVVAGAYHVLVSPFTSPLWVAVGVLFFLGPSPPDWGSLLRTPRERWETLVGLEERIETHAAAEGVPDRQR